MSEQRKRSSHTKSRSGCMTCRIRHKKCDETKPNCRQCTSTGRICDGYVQLPDKRTRAWREQTICQAETLEPKGKALYRRITPSVSILAPPIKASQIGHTWSERWYLELFAKLTVHQCSEYFEDVFWCNFIHQVLETQPAARYAAMSFAVRHWQYQLEGLRQTTDDKSILALQYSSKSISYLRNSLIRDTSDRAHRETVLVTCLILTMLALYENDTVAASRHFNSGFKLFRYWEAVDYDSNSNGRALKQAFVQLHLNYMTSNNPRLFVDNQRLVSPQSADISAHRPPRDYIKIRAEQFLGVIPQVAMTCYPHGGFCIGPASLALRPGTPPLLCVLRLWRSQLKTFSTQKSVLSEFDHYVLILMELWTVTINVKLTVCDSYESLEVRYDDYNEQFRAVVEMARSLLQESSSKVLPATIIQSSLVPALLWCGMKCRDSLIRADIVRLIDEIKGQNTTISAFLMALKKVIQYESGDVKLGEQIPETARLASVKLNIIPGQEKVDLWYRTSALDPHLIDDDLWLYNSISV